MTESKKHPYIAGFSDFFFSFLIIGAVLALISSIFEKPISLWILLSFYPFVIIILILYYRKWSKKNEWLSPGELLSGRLIEENKKTWKNPYGINRFFLFLVIFITLIIMANSWDFISEGIIITFIRWIAITIKLALISIGLVKAGQNEKSWIFFVTIPFGLIFLVPTTPSNVTIKYVFGFLILINWISFLSYQIIIFLKKKERKII